MRRRGAHEQRIVKLVLAVVIVAPRPVACDLVIVRLGNEADDQAGVVDPVSHLLVDVAEELLVITPRSNAALLQRLVNRLDTIVVVAAPLVHTPICAKRGAQDCIEAEGLTATRGAGGGP